MNPALVLALLLTWGCAKHEAPLPAQTGPLEFFSGDHITGATCPPRTFVPCYVNHVDATPVGVYADARNICAKKNSGPGKCMRFPNTRRAKP